MAGLRLAYLGPAGTYSEQAALHYVAAAGLEAALAPAPSNTAAIQAVAEGRADEAVAPIENSLEGSVTEVLDVLIHQVDLRIRREVVLPIEHCLLAPAGRSLESVRVVLSHPQALAQCRGYLQRRLPAARTEAALSTVQAVEEALERDGAAAIAPRRAAEIYDVVVLAEGIQDDARNRTRFVVLGHDDAPPSGDDKTSLAFNLEDRPGALVRVLQRFAEASINLTKIESRPAREALGVYVFLVDLHGHRRDPAVAAALEQVQTLTTRLKIFGSYPRFQDG